MTNIIASERYLRYAEAAAALYSARRKIKFEV
jgi:hypothetical protein